MIIRNLIVTGLGLMLFVPSATASFSMNVEGVKSTPAPEVKTSFSCDTSGEYPVTVANYSESGKQKSWVFFSWLPKHFPNPSKAEAICQTAATNLQKYYNKNLTLSVGKKEPLVCLTPTEMPCTEDSLNLFSLDTNANAEDVLYDIINQELKPNEENTEKGDRGDFVLRSVHLMWLPF